MGRILRSFALALPRFYTCDGAGKPCAEDTVKKVLGIFALLGALVGAMMFWRKRQDDDEFLDEELE